MGNVDEDTVYKFTKAVVESRSDWAARDKTLNNDFNHGNALAAV
jgi:TRAP-type uncharacterized transport system substrate-binding protein